jgi:hypothetical protein
MYRSILIDMIRIESANANWFFLLLHHWPQNYSRF